MMALVRICRQHRHAVERDLISLGFNGIEDYGTPRLTLSKLAAIVLASPPNTAVYHAETGDGAFTPTDQLLARQAGLVNVEGTYQSPEEATVNHDGIASLTAGAPTPHSVLPSFKMDGKAVMLDAYTPEEFTRRREEIAAKVRAAKEKSPDKVVKDKYDPFAAARAARAERAGRRQGLGGVIHDDNPAKALRGLTP